MSKGFDMIGWRLGFVAGHERIVRAFADVKNHCDSGQFIAIQKAAARALGDPSIPLRIRAKYERRLRKLVAALREVGFRAAMPGGTYFLYVPAPRSIEDGPAFDTAEAASQFLIRERSICTVPWDDAGAYLRFSVTYEAPSEPAEDAMMAQLNRRLAKDRFVW
jgi:LL-diaminopimelate aminotransferase